VVSPEMSAELLELIAKKEIEEIILRLHFEKDRARQFKSIFTSLIGKDET
jgi:hypothetical protein